MKRHCISFHFPKKCLGAPIKRNNFELLFQLCWQFVYAYRKQNQKKEKNYHSDEFMAQVH